MVGIRKICINTQEINSAIHYNQNLSYSGDRFSPRVIIPDCIFEETRFSFSPSQIVDWFIDPESKEKDIIVFLLHRGEVRFKYEPILETQLETVMSVK